MHQYCKHKKILILHVKTQKLLWALTQILGTVLSLSSISITHMRIEKEREGQK